ncbi:MAG: hypothetical protein ACRDJH_20340, partial [Thermomicrobiales bacterium]
MRSPILSRRLLTPCLITLLAAALGPLLAPEAVPAAEKQAILLIGSRLVDPATGETLWAAERADWVTSALSPDGILYLGVPDQRARSLDVLAVSPIDPKPRRIAQEGWDTILIGGVSPAGDRLWLFMKGGGLPSGLKPLSLPGGMAAAEPKPRAYRDEGFGMLLSDGSRWYGTVWPDWELVEVRFADGAPHEVTPLPVSVGETLLLSPSGRRLYVINYRG